MLLIIHFARKHILSPHPCCSFISSRINGKFATHHVEWPNQLTRSSGRGLDHQDVALEAHVVADHTRHEAVLEAATNIAEAIVDPGRP